MTLDATKTKQLIDYWVKGSTEELRSAKEIINQTSRYVSGLFFLHLALEKALKALFCKTMSSHAPYSHNLLGLTEKIGLTLTESDIQILAEINEFNLEARYPDDKFSLHHRATKSFALDYLQKAETLQAWIFEKLNN
ncbi:MAG: HEPN domain-containing protein [Proteobacteria bacterium]|nr:HEPN domain-containing protein [Pseudomonadota bacterium]